MFYSELTYSFRIVFLPMSSLRTWSTCSYQFSDNWHENNVPALTYVYANLLSKMHHNQKSLGIWSQRKPQQYTNSLYPECPSWPFVWRDNKPNLTTNSNGNKTLFGRIRHYWTQIELGLGSRVKGIYQVGDEPKTIWHFWFAKWCPCLDISVCNILLHLWPYFIQKLLKTWITSQSSLEHHSQNFVLIADEAPVWEHIKCERHRRINSKSYQHKYQYLASTENKIQKIGYEVDREHTPFTFNTWNLKKSLQQHVSKSKSLWLFSLGAQYSISSQVEQCH